MGRFIDLTGKRFGRLTVISRDETLGTKRPFWLCMCDCGVKKIANGHTMRIGRVSSCGCLRREHLLSVRPPDKHGMKYSPEYKVWDGIKQRCGNPNYHHFDDYGGRGIKVCQRWLDDFMNFYADMGPRPSNKHTIERCDNDKGYSPDNCNWALMHEQSRNKRTSRILELDGIRKNLVDWADSLGIPRGSLKTALRRGYTLESAIRRRAVA